jgi:hypothetical protein
MISLVDCKDGYAYCLDGVKTAGIFVRRFNAFVVIQERRGSLSPGVVEAQAICEIECAPPFEFGANVKEVNIKPRDPEREAIVRVPQAC